jgi:hypothetical protein
VTISANEGKDEVETRPRYWCGDAFGRLKAARARADRGTDKAKTARPGQGKDGEGELGRRTWSWRRG